MFAYYAWKAPAFTEAKLQDPIPAKIYDKNGELVKTLDNGQRHEHVNLKRRAEINERRSTCN